MTPALQSKIQATRQQILSSNPALQSEETSLLGQLESLKHPNPSVTSEDRLRIHQQWVHHENAVRDAAVKIDPTLAPYF